MVKSLFIVFSWIRNYIVYEHFKCWVYQKLIVLLQLSLAKKKFAHKFNSYVVGTERETKFSHSEPLSSNSLSRMQHGKNSNKKI